MTEIGEQGERFNFSSASRAAHFRPDIDRIRRYDPYRQKYVRLTRIVQGIGLLTAGLSLRLWTTDHGIWAGVIGVLALLLLLGGYMLGRGASAAVYSGGLLIPAHITSLEPLQLVALANMSSDDEDTDETYGIRQVTLKELPVHSLRIGERVPCAASFGGNHNGVWGYFEPRPLVWATDDPVLITVSIAVIPEEEWTRLYQLTRQLADIQDDQVAFYDAALTFIDAK